MKTDFLWEKTDNVAIEKTALTHTEADFFIYKLHNRDGLLLFPTWLIKNMYRQFPHRFGGDQMHEIALVPVENFIRHATPLL